MRTFVDSWSGVLVYPHTLYKHTSLKRTPQRPAVLFATTYQCIIPHFNPRYELMDVLCVIGELISILVDRVE